MKLFLMQHGEAKPEAEDPERSLTVKGEEETRKISGAAKRIGIRPSRIYHSGKKRQPAGSEAQLAGLILVIFQEPSSLFKLTSRRVVPLCGFPPSFSEARTTHSNLTTAVSPNKVSSFKS